MNPPRTPEPADTLDATIASAQVEARAQEDAAARVTRQRSEQAGRGGRWQLFALLLLLPVLIATLWWAWRHPAPTEVDLQQGRVLTLELAAQAVRDEMLRTGAPPSDLAALLPAAAGVEIRATDDVVELRLAGVPDPVSVVRPGR